MAHNWPAPGGVDPYLKVETPLTPEMLRVVNSIQSYRYYLSQLVSSLVFVEYEFVDQGRTDANFDSSRLMLINDGTGAVEFSFDGVTVAGVLNNGEVKVDDERRERSIWLRKVAGPDTAMRVWAW